MSGNTELLNFVYQNSQMGMESLSQLLEIARMKNSDRVWKSSLIIPEFHNEAKRLLLGTGTRMKSPLGMFDKLKQYLMINMQTMSDKIHIPSGADADRGQQYGRDERLAGPQKI